MELVARHRCPSLGDAMRTISSFADGSLSWTIVQAADAKEWGILRRVVGRDSFEKADPLYRQWVFTKATARAAAVGRLDVVKLLSDKFTDCYVTFADEEAAKHGRLEVLEWLHQHHSNVRWDGDGLSAALRANQVEVVHWLHANVPQSLASGVDLDAAASSGNLKLLKWAVSVNPTVNPTSMPEESLKTGNLELIKWVVENGFYGLWHRDIVLDFAVENGQLEIVKYMTEIGVGRCSPDVMEKAGENGHFEMVKWLMANLTDALGDDDTLDGIAGAGRLEIVKWVAECYPEHFTVAAMTWAATNGHLDVVIYLHEFGDYEFACNESAMDGAAKNGHLDVIIWLHNNRSEGCTHWAMDGAAKRGHLDVIKWLDANREEGCSEMAIDRAADFGHLDVIKWLAENYEEGCTSAAITSAASHNHMEVVKWLYEHGYDRCRPRSYEFGALGGYLDMLKWIYKNLNVKYASVIVHNALDLAAGNGHVETLRWLDATQAVRGSPKAMHYAASNGMLDMMILLQSEFDSECTHAVFIAAAERGDLEMQKWLFQQFPDTADIDYFASTFHESSHLNNWIFLESEVIRRQ